MTFSNLGPWDRSVRLLLALAMLSLGWGTDDSGPSLVLRVMALYPLITAATGWCPVQALLGIARNR